MAKPAVIGSMNHEPDYDEINGRTRIGATQAFRLLMPSCDYKRAKCAELIMGWQREWKDEDIWDAIKWAWLKRNPMWLSVPAFLEHNCRRKNESIEARPMQVEP